VPFTAQVKFRASRLVVGDERFDAEFKVDLQAVMSSKVTKQPHLVHSDTDHTPAPAADAAAAGGGSNGAAALNGSAAASQSASYSSSSSNGAAGSSAVSAAAAGAGVSSFDMPVSTSSSSSSSSSTAVIQEAPAAAAVATASSTTATLEQAVSSEQQQQQQSAVQQQQQQQQPTLYWQRTSALSCKVNLSMTLRLPHPLSIVPGPLLSTTASLVAKLVMQSLLPSFLELLSTDYGRWATGSSRTAPVGSLVAAGKQHLKQQS